MAVGNLVGRQAVELLVEVSREGASVVGRVEAAMVVETDWAVIMGVEDYSHQAAPVAAELLGVASMVAAMVAEVTVSEDWAEDSMAVVVTETLVGEEAVAKVG